MWRKVAISIGAVLVIGSLIAFLVNLYVTNEKDKIYGSLDTRLDSYNYAETIARSMKDLTAIKSKDKYSELRSTLKKNMTDDLWNEYFPTEKFTGTKIPYNVVEESIKGYEVEKDEYIFKLELSLQDDEYSVPLTWFVYMKNGIVYKIESLG